MKPPATSRRLPKSIAPALIKTKYDHARAIQRIAELMEADPAPGTAEGNELELHAHLAEVFEMKHYCIGWPDPVGAILFCMDQQGADSQRPHPLSWHEEPGFGNPQRWAVADCPNDSAIARGVGNFGGCACR